MVFVVVGILIVSAVAWAVVLVVGARLALAFRRRYPEIAAAEFPRAARGGFAPANAMFMLGPRAGALLEDDGRLMRWRRLLLVATTVSVLLPLVAALIVATLVIYCSFAGGCG